MSSTKVARGTCGAPSDSTKSSGCCWQTAPRSISSTKGRLRAIVFSHNSRSWLHRSSPVWWPKRLAGDGHRVIRGRPQGYTFATWQENLDTVRSDIIAQRTEIVIEQMRSAGVFPLIDAPAFHVNGQYQHGGHVARANRLSMTVSAGEIYYTLDGTDPRLRGTPPPQSATSIVAENAPRKVLVPAGPLDTAWNSDTFDDAGWLSAAGGVGYERGSGYEPLIELDLEQRMYDKQTTCYVRIPFALNAVQIREASHLILAIRYDDGFVAYLNGVEVARALVAGVPAWNSTASGSHEAGGT